MRERIGRYEILEEHGRGAMGAVYKARDPQIGRIVAVKTILTSHLPPDEIAVYKQRLYREAQAAGQMSHPGIVTIFDIAEDESGDPYLVMEFVEGTTLEKLAADGALPFEMAVDLGIQIAEALDYAHRRGVIHRDIKPENILITAEGNAKLADFGIAKLGGTQFTQSGQLVGTPSFMSPEQFTGQPVDSRSDLFSFGAVLYWTFTGRKPFATDSVTAAVFQVVYSTPIPARQLNPSLPAEAEIILSRCLAKNRDNRYATAHELADDLEALKTRRAISATPLAEPEKVVLTAPPAPAAPAPATSDDRTIVFDRKGAPPTAASASRWAAMALVTLALLVAVFVVGNKLRRGTGVETPAPPAATSTPATSGPTNSSPTATRTAPATQAEETKKASEPAGLPPPPESSATTPPRAPARASRPTPKAMGMAVLGIECQHDFREGTLAILADGKPFFQTTLRRRKILGVFKSGAALRASKPIPAGRHVLRVRVQSPAEGYSKQGEISGNFSKDGSRVLLIESTKAGKLNLRWHEEGPKR